MCVIIAKPIGTNVPNNETFSKCFSANSDGCGYMFTYNNNVYIRKGFMSLKSFYEDLGIVRKELKIKDFKDLPMVFHFRITTQGGVKKELTHPYPICENYDDMRKLKITCDFGVAHNGIISLTSEPSYSYWDYRTNTYVSSNSVNHNDTMKFVKDYLSLIVGNNQYFSKVDRTNKLINNLLGSNNKLAILNKNGFIKLYGDFIMVNGLFFSNTYWRDVRTNTNVKVETTKSGFKVVKSPFKQTEYLK